MKRAAFGLAGGALLVASLALQPAAAATIDVEVRNLEMVPAGVPAAAGDTIRWNVTSGQHRLEAYAGGSFDTGPIGGPGTTTATHVFGGGTVAYRCTVPGHSTLDAAECSGMCGVISDTPPPIPAPIITVPADGASFSTNGVTIGGTAQAPAASVRLFGTDGGRLADVEVSSGSWSRGFTFANGEHTVTAIALDDDGFESAPDQVTFTVTVAADTAPPTVELSQPGPLVFRPIDVAGLARDDVVVASVEVVVRNVILGERVTPQVTCPTCGTPLAQFSARTPVLPGLYEVTATAVDGSGKTGEASTFVLAI